MRILCLNPSDVPDFWRRLEPWIDRAYAKTELRTPPDLRDDLARRHKQLWVAYSPEEGKFLGVAITQLAKMRATLHCQIVACGGVEAVRWVDRGIRCIEDWASREGCTKVTLQGRPGWARLLRRYRRSQVILELDLRRHEQRKQERDAILLAD